MSVAEASGLQCILRLSLSSRQLSMCSNCWIVWAWLIWDQPPECFALHSQHTPHDHHSQGCQEGHHIDCSKRFVYVDARASGFYWLRSNTVLELLLRLVACMIDDNLMCTHVM